MKTQRVTAIVSLIISAISIVLTLWLYPHGIGYDISVSVFSGSLFAVVIAIVSFFTEERQKVQLILFHTRNIKVLSNGFLNADTKEKFIHICKDIEAEFDIAQLAASDIQVCGQRVSKKVAPLWGSTSSYVCEMLVELQNVECNPKYDYNEALSKIKFKTIKEMDTVIQAWMPLAKKYMSESLFNQYCDLDEIQLGKEQHKTMREIWKEHTNGQT